MHVDENWRGDGSLEPTITVPLGVLSRAILATARSPSSRITWEVMGAYVQSPILGTADNRANFSITVSTPSSSAPITFCVIGMPQLFSIELWVPPLWSTVGCSTSPVKIPTTRGGRTTRNTKTITTSTTSAAKNTADIKMCNILELYRTLWKHGEGGWKMWESGANANLPHRLVDG